MTHVQVDDCFFDHPKVLAVSKDAKLLSVAAICYCGNMLTDGFIPYGAVAVLAAKTGVSRPKIVVDELIAAHLWDVAEGGYNAHDYLDYNTSAEKVRAKRDAARERMQRGRSQEVRANNERSSQNVQIPTTETTTTSSIEPNGSSELEDGQPPKIPESRQTRIPDDFVLDDDMLSWATSKGFGLPQIEHHTEAFASHWRGEGGPKSKKINWRQAWQTWMSRETPGRWPGAVKANGRASPPNGKPDPFSPEYPAWERQWRIDNKVDKPGEYT